ncbi:MAG: PH domain-containing protein [Roseibium sp.]|nr:PH domain-containing protein [Roseibium sp.]
MTHSHHGGPEHDYEPVPGLPARLPDGEYIVWQGRPSGRLVARRVLKINWFAGYCALILIWTLIAGFMDGRVWGSVLFSTGALMILSAVLLGLLEAFAWGVSKTTLYTITNKRVVMRIGVALSATFNLPFAKVVSADVRVDPAGNGDICLVMARGHRLSFFTFWPHVRGWRAGAMVPQMICLENAASAARILADALASHAAVHRSMTPAAPLSDVTATQGVAAAPVAAE